ncbi:nucleotide disphospho-sugar-binding domain-containing protein [Streptomyces sp. NRRL F-5630]|uniref:nucleotide disphospho-sugar-binding domain-containing protein n=1 Tax=Streptomyces sp. NRRL F-5630 TaxID=1463864 RepID=UPI0004C82C90|nr:nucleotide disphospho-sugar-binding domain-containing protein [Streptomyces sp. NRRL F-5630]
MRILFVTSVSSSHLAPMVPLAWALRAAGHDVRVACDADTAPGALALGLAVVRVSTDGGFARRHRENVRGVPGEPYYREKDALTRMFAENALAMLGGLAALIDHWQPHAVVHEPVAFAAEAVAAARGIPALRHLWGPDVFGTPHGAWLRERARELVTAEVPGSVWPPSARELVVDPCPAPMQRLGPGEKVPIRFVPVDRPGTVPTWLLDLPEEERICVTWGTFTDGVPGGHPLMRAVRGLSRPGTEVVLVARPEDLARLGELPAKVRTVSGVPLHAVLPSCTAVVHHGGANTALGAVARGLPQLVVSDTFERALNGGRLAEAGVGLHLGSQDADPDAVEAAAQQLVTDDRYARAAAALQGQALTRPSPAQIASGFEELVARCSVPVESITEGA